MQNGRGARAGRSGRPHGGGGLAGPRHSAVDRGAGQGGRGPWWTAPAGAALAAARTRSNGPAMRGRQAAVHGGPRAGAGRVRTLEAAGRRRWRHWRRSELPAAALQGSAGRAEGMGGRGSARRARWRPHLRETSTAKRSSTAAARISKGGGGSDSAKMVATRARVSKVARARAAAEGSYLKARRSLGRVRFGNR